MSTTGPLPGLKIAKRTGIAPFIAMDVLAAASARAADGQDVVHLEVGEPGGGPPRAVLEAARRALGRVPLGYTEALGRPALRRAIAGHYRVTYDLEVDPAQVAVTVGASGAFVLSFLAAFDPGDRVVVPEPAFPAYKNILRALGVEVVRLGLGPQTGFALTVEQLAAVAPPVHGLVIASPANPTGTMLQPGQLEALARHCRARGIRLIADEIYHGITYERPAVSVLTYDPEAVVINGFSKYFGMTGWRLGWLVAPPDLVRPIELLAQNLFISAPALAQEAAPSAFGCGAELALRIEGYRRNRAALLERLPAAGLDRLAPVDGAFYLYADVAQLTDDSAAWCEALLEATGVALTPGADFDSVDGHRFVRLAFAGTHERVVAGADRLAAWLRARG
jgi:aspartate/methionine/tyrosine aminotransferase